MTLLDRYLGVTVAKGVLTALLVFLALDTFIDFLTELDEIGRGHYTTLEAILFIVLTTPERIHLFFPVAALVGAIIGLGMLAGHSELTVMRAAGISVLRIIVAVMKVALVLMLIAVVLGEVIAPYSSQYAETRRSIALSDQITLKTKYGFWVRDQRSYINIRGVEVNGAITDIYVYEFDDNHRLRVSTYAARARYVEDSWILEGIVQSHVGEDGVRSEEITQAEWDSFLSPALLNIVVVKPNNMPIWALREYIEYLHANGQNAQRLEMAFWMKVFSPITIGVMVFVAVPFVFGSLRSVGVGQRVLVGALVGIGFYIVNQLLNQLGLAYSFDPLVSAMLAPMLFLMAGVALLRRV